MLNFVLCDDNLSLLERLSKMLENIFMKNNYDARIAYSTDNVDSVLEFIRNNKVDVLFLDIDLKSDINGLELANKIRQENKDVYIIFTTGHLEYAMVAYKYKTFDYLAKPITLSRLEDTVNRLFDDALGSPKRYIKIDNKNTLIDENDVHYIKRDGMKLVYHTSDRDYETYSSFNKISECLPDTFIRCHKSFIVNLKNIKNVDPVVNRVFFDKDSNCDIGPKFKKSFLEVMNNYGNIK